MRYQALAIAVVLLSSGRAVAADTRIKTLPYDADEIVRVVGHSGIQSTIQFGSDERIENVAVGDSSAWQVTPNRRGSVLFVKPIAPVSRTNMTVVTDKRTYMFDLTAAKKGGASPLYVLRFSYPDAPAEVIPVKHTPIVMASATAPAAPRSPERLNFDWKVKGFKRLRPGRVFDDTQSLYLSWSNTIPLPAILAVAEDGREGPLNYRMSGEYIVLTPVPQNIVLRYGKKAVTISSQRKQNGTTPQSINTAPAPRLATPYVSANKSSVTVGNTGTSVSAAARLAPVSMSRRESAPRVEVADLSKLHSDKLTEGSHGD